MVVSAPPSAMSPAYVTAAFALPILFVNAMPEGDSTGPVQRRYASKPATVVSPTTISPPSSLSE